MQELLRCVPSWDCCALTQPTGLTALEDDHVPSFCHQRECFKEKNLGVVEFL